MSTAPTALPDERVFDPRPESVATEVGNGAVPHDEHQGDEEEQSPLNLPDDFWSARARLAHIRAAARSRLVCPDAVLGSILGRVAALSSHTLALDVNVGSPVGLTFLAQLVGPPEAGKSAAANCGAELIPSPPGFLDLMPIGSGEGLVECLFDLVEEADDKGRKTKVKRQVRHAAIFHVDEGAVLGELGNRSGSTLFSTLRTAFTHGNLGNMNASVERRRIVPGTAYVYGVTVGTQPEMAGPLLDQAPAGTPQRFAWFSAIDPSGAAAPDEDWPGEIDWQPLDVDELPRRRGMQGKTLHPLTIAPTIRDEIRARRRSIQNGETIVEALDAHRDLVRLKVAALLGLLDQRYTVREDDWRLAGIVMDTSRRVRDRILWTLAHVERTKETASADRAARRDIHVESSKAAKTLASAVGSAARVIQRHATKATHRDQGGGCTRRCISQAMAGKHREFVTVDDVIAAAEREGLIVAKEDRWFAAVAP